MLKIGVSVVVLLITSSLYSADALRCYSCNYMAPGTDKICLSNQEKGTAQNIINCSKKFCTIQRKELLTPSKTLISFMRGCEDKPLHLNDVVDDSTHRTYYYACTKDLCNSGNGISIPGTALDPDNMGGENIIVKGRNGSNSINRNMKFCILSIILFNLFCNLK